MNKRISFLALMYLLSFSSTGLSVLSVETVPGTIRVPQNFLTIQEAIDASEPGGIILVASGTYHENVTVWKPLTIIGESRDSTIVDQIGAFAVFHITADNVIINGFTVRSGSVGIWIDNSHHDTIASNVITNNDDGVWVTFSNSGVISNNIITNNVFFGLYIEASNYTALNGNTVTENTYGIYMENCGNGLTNENIIALNYGDGIHAIYSNDNAMFHNMICNNSLGIRLEGSNANSIFENTLLDNFDQAWVEEVTINAWDNGSKGNYWSDYNGMDSDYDGIGDTPYIINVNNTDRYPLMGLTVFNDIAITNVEAFKTVVGQGFALDIDVAIQNQGNFTATFNVIAFSNTTIIETKKITLSNGNSTTHRFFWNTSGFAKGNCTISAVADIVPGETDTTDNNCTDGWVLITKVGDLGGPVNYVPTFFACDGKVNGYDLALFIACYRKEAPPEAMYLADLGGPVNYVPTFFACDGKVDGYDLALWIACYKGLGP